MTQAESSCCRAGRPHPHTEFPLSGSRVLILSLPPSSLPPFVGCIERYYAVETICLRESPVPFADSESERKRKEEGTRHRAGRGEEGWKEGVERKRANERTNCGKWADFGSEKDDLVKTQYRQRARSGLLCQHISKRRGGREREREPL